MKKKLSGVGVSKKSVEAKKIKNKKKKKVTKPKYDSKKIISKNIVFIIIFGLQIVFALIGYARVDATIDRLILAMNDISGTFGGTSSEIVEIYTSQMGKGIVACISLAAVFIGYVNLCYALFDKLENHKVSLIVSNAILAYFGTTFISIMYSLCSVVGIVFSCLLTKPKLSKEEKLALKLASIPKKFKFKKSTKYTYIKSIGMIVIYFALMFIPFDKLVPHVNEYVINVPIYIILIGCAVAFYYSEYKQMFATFKNNFGNGCKYILKNWGKMLLIYFPFALVISFVFGMSENQNALNNMNALYVLVLSVIYAPIVEETVFRGALRKLIKSDIAFIIVSGILFGLLHTIFQEETVLLTVARAVPYAVMGSTLASLYTKNNNMMYNIGVHGLHNLIVMLPTLIGLVF